MSPKTRQRLLVWVGYPAFAIFTFLVFAYWTFPYDRVRDYIVQEVERPMGPGGGRQDSGLRLQIDELSPSFLTGVVLEGVRLTKLPTPTPGATTEEKPIVVEIEEISARISLLPLLTGTTAISFDAVIGGGEIEGHFALSEEETHVEAEIDAIELRQLGVLSAAIGLPVSGVLGGTVDLTIGKEASATKGSIDLAITGLVIGDARAKLKLEGMGEGLSVGRIEAGKLVVKATVENGVARFTQLGTEGGRDLNVRGGGQLRLVQPARLSRLELLVNVRFSDAFKTRDDRTRGLFAMLDVLPRLRAAKTRDGALQWQLAGGFTGSMRAVAAGSMPMPR
jgi:type II secretion system protein N